MAMAKLAKGKPQELANLSAIRARFCELLGDRLEPKKNAGELFTVGLFSLIDAIMDDSMENVLQKLPFSQSIKEALVGQNGPLGEVLQLVVAYERGGWQALSELCGRVGIPEETLPQLYRETLAWAQALEAP
jgi:EAL and modified HD-GYP domain-containing signal transduction protein